MSPDEQQRLAPPRTQRTPRSPGPQPAQRNEPAQRNKPAERNEPAQPSLTEPPREQFGPALRGGRARSGWRRIAFRSAVAMSAIVLLLTAGVAAILLHGVGAVDRVDVPSLTEPGDFVGDGVADLEALSEVLNVLVVGSDSREGLTAQQLLALGTEEEDGQRTDTIMLATLDPRREVVAVLSFPRDLLVTRCDGTRGRINAAYGIGEETGVGGPECLVETVQRFSGIPVHHFVQVNFAGFIDVVDALGGVTVYLDEPMQDVAAGVDLPAGCVDMDGITSLGFVRARRIDSDFGRIARQQRFIREVLRESVSVGTLVNLPRLFAVVDAGARSIEADESLTLTKMRRIAFSFRDLTPDRLDTRTVPAIPRRVNGVDFVVAKEEDAETLFQAFREGTIFPEGLGQEPAFLTVADVPPLLVLNGAGVAGLASEAAAALEERGLVVAETGNADSFDFQRTQVVYPPDRLEEAELVADALLGAVLVPGADGDPITVVVGQDLDVAALHQARAEPAPEAEEPPEEAEPAFVGATPSEVDC